MSDAVQARAPGKGLRIALAISVALNLAVVGVVAGAALKHGGPGGMDGGRDIGFGPFAEALSREDRKALRNSILARAPELRASRRDVRQDTQALLMALRAVPFDAEGLGRVMDQQRDRMTGRLEIGQAVMRDFLISMTPAARSAFADRLETLMLRDDRGDQGKAAP